jgi:hypothetical protein
MMVPEHTHIAVMILGVAAFAGGLLVALVKKIPMLGYPLIGVGGVILFLGWTCFQTVIVVREHGEIRALVYEEAGAPVMGGRGTDILNETSKSVYVFEILYGTENPSLTPPLEVPAHARAHTGTHVDYIGPKEKPPRQIETRSGGESRHWLTWDLTDLKLE